MPFQAREQSFAAPMSPSTGVIRPTGDNRPEYPNERIWRQIFRDGHRKLHAYRRVAGWLPSPPRCNVCRVPFEGVGGRLMRLRGCHRSDRNSLYCNRCDRVIRRKPGATDVELSMVFADVRGSVSFAAQAEHDGQRAEYIRRLRHFEAAVRLVLERTNGFIIDVVGDEVVAVYPPGLCGPRHAAFALEAARALTKLAAQSGRDGGPVLPFGVGVHTGEVFLGNRFTVDEEPAEDQLSKVRIIGDHANLAARLAAAAGSSEALVSDATIAALPHAPPTLEHRRLSIRGRAELVGVHVVTP
jgi:adenylate cyclase